MVRLFFVIVFLPIRFLFYFVSRIKNLNILRFRVVHILIDQPNDTPLESGFLKAFKSQKPRQYILLAKIFRLIHYCSGSKRRPDILIQIGQINGAARSWEWMRVIKRLRKEGFSVFCYLNEPNTLALLVASYANSITIAPSATIDLTWGFLQNFYLSDALKLLGIKAQIISEGKFKSFGEIFSRKSPSKPANDQMNKLVKSLRETIINSMNEGRKQANWEKAFATGLLPADEAADLKLIDYIMYHSDWKKVLTNNRVNVSLNKALSLLKPFQIKLRKPKRVGVLIANGNIVDSPEPNPVAINGIDYENTLKKIASENLDHLVIRVNSPGGSAYASDRIWSAIMNATNQSIPKEKPITTDKKRSKKKKDKPKSEIPVWISQSEVAASGGYFLSACSKKRVFATPLTITGSIGVVMASFEASNALKKLKIDPYSYSVFPQSGFSDWSKPITVEQKKILKQNISSVYKMFKNRIITGRGIDENKLEKNAQGRVFSGVDAIEAGLVDQLGGFFDIIEQISVISKGNFCLIFYPVVKKQLSNFFSLKGVISFFFPFLELTRNPREVIFIDPRFVQLD